MEGPLVGQTMKTMTTPQLKLTPKEINHRQTQQLVTEEEKIRTKRKEMRNQKIRRKKK